MKRLVILFGVLCGCAARQQPKPLVLTSATWIEPWQGDAMLVQEFPQGHWSCPTGYQFEGQREEMGQRVVKRKVANGTQQEVKPRCWKRQ